MSGLRHFDEDYDHQVIGDRDLSKLHIIIPPESVNIVKNKRANLSYGAWFEEVLPKYTIDDIIEHEFIQYRE